MNQNRFDTQAWYPARAALLLVAALGLGANALAAPTDIAQVPLVTSSATLVKPNLMFVLDDSGSMDRAYMPDDANFGSGKYGFYASQCNGLAYNPATTYALPVYYDGTTYPLGSFTFPSPTALSSIRTTTPTSLTIATGLTVGIVVSGSNSYAAGDIVTLYSNDDDSILMVGTVSTWNSGSRTVTVNVTETAGSGTMTNARLANGDNRPFYYTYSSTQPRLGYTYNSSGLITSTAFYQECNSSVGSTPGFGKFTKVVMKPTSGDLQNYRNWYTYNRTRSLTMRTAASRAFAPIGDGYRVGFSTISSERVSGSKFLDVAAFTSGAGGQKDKFYTELFAADPDSYTPLRGALSKAGRYFAKKATQADGSAQSYDPVQYSCQRNYTILTTDGYWNTDTEVSGNGSSSYGPDDLARNDVGQRDGGGTPRPMKDNTVTTVKERTSTLQQRSVTPQWTTGTTTLQGRTVTGSWQTSTSSLQSRSRNLEASTSSNSGSTWTGWTPVASCTWDNNGSSRRRCRYSATWSAWTNAATCTVNNSTGTSNGTTWTGNGIACQYTSWSAFADTPSCTAQAQDTTSPHTVATATQCVSPTYSAWADTATCTASATEECRYTAPVNTTTTSCTPVAQSTGPSYTVGTATQCTALPPAYGTWTNTATCAVSAINECRYTAWTALSLVPSCTAVAQSVAPSYTVDTARECQSTSSGGNSNSLADVAMYYYETDLRTTALGNCASTLDGTPTGIATDVCLNNVGPSGLDTALHQHMTTFTLGMGVNGTLNYQANYPLLPAGDFRDITQGSKDWPDAITSAGAARIDDLWHAAVNGRGRYFSANDPTSLADSLSSALAAIIATTGSGSGAAASTLQPVAGDNKLFIAKYKSGFWIGDLVARTIDPATGVISGPVWSAATQLQASVNAGTPRNIYYATRNAGLNTTVRRDFTHANLSADGLNGHFDDACSKTINLTQCATLAANKAAADAADLAAPTTATAAAKAAAAAAQDSANSGIDMVSYLRGGSNPVFRTRVTTDTDIAGGILGDIIGGAPVYAGQPSFKYTENGYASFVAAVKATNAGAGRTGVAYTASNDGMLHAFNGATGNEMWAYVPSMVMDRMYRLADKDYAYRHEYFVNGAPVIGDIYVPGSPGAWKTILVGGLGAGGRGYYALDITNPDNPIPLWEFTNDSLGGDSNLGLSFGNPVITKRADGRWVVVFTSGYNNITPGDGNGHLFMVNANTGERVLDIPTFTSGTTPAGTSTTPSGLGKINAWVDSEIDNTAKRFYGGDLLGNLWRFDTDNLVAPNSAALRLAYFSAGGVEQPITTQPSLAEVKYSGSPYPVVYVGTGKYLGSTDLASTATQSVYAIKDSLTNTPLGDVHADASVVAQTLSLPADATDAHAPRDVTRYGVNWATGNGWRVDLITPTLPILGERVNVDMQLLHNTLTVASNIPSNDACDAGGSSYLYQFDIGNGSIPSTLGGNIVGRWLGGSMVVGISWVTLQLPGSGAGTGRTITITVDNRGVPRTDDVPPPSPPTATGRRTSWRELVQ